MAAAFLLPCIQALVYYPVLPEVMAGHFADDGHPNGWSSKFAFFTIYFAILLSLTGGFFWLPRFLGKLPGAAIHLPHKQYWLTGERREQTLDFIYRKLQWAGIVTLLFLASILQLVIDANMGPVRKLNTPLFLLLMGVYYLYLGVWAVGFWKQFRHIS